MEGPIYKWFGWNCEHQYLILFFEQSYNECTLIPYGGSETRSSRSDGILIEPFLEGMESDSEPLWDPLLEFRLEGLGDRSADTSTICTKPSLVSCNFWFADL